MEDLFYQEDNFQEEGTCKVVNSFNEDVSRFMLYSMKLKYCNRDGEIQIDQTGIWTKTPWIFSHVLYQLSYLVPVHVFEPVWPSQYK